MRNPDLMEQVTNYASNEMKQCPGVSESAALEILCAVSLWLNQWYKYCDNPEEYPKPVLKMSLKNSHNLL